MTLAFLDTAETLDTLHTKLEALKYCTDSECRVLEEELDIEFK